MEKPFSARAYFELRPAEVTGECDGCVAANDSALCMQLPSCQAFIWKIVEVHDE